MLNAPTHNPPEVTANLIGDEGTFIIITSSYHSAEYRVKSYNDSSILTGSLKEDASFNVLQMLNFILLSLGFG